MNTAVQIRPIAQRDRPGCELVYGKPRELVPGEFGSIALFGPGELVAYRLQYGRRFRLYVFRTLDVADLLAAHVPGVRPRVRLLLELRSIGRVRLARRLFAYLARRDRDPSDLSDGFYTRVGAALGGRLPRHKILVALIDRFRPGRREDSTTRKGLRPLAVPSSTTAGCEQDCAAAAPRRGNRNDRVQQAAAARTGVGR